MDAARFDRLTRSLAVRSPRRSIVAGLVGLSGVSASRRDAAVARSRKKHKLTRNAFGCVDVGNFCRKDSHCSNRCRKQRCRAHDTEGCPANADQCAGEVVTCGAGGRCFRTTGEASFCGGEGDCVACQTDAQCVRRGFGAGAACVVCPICAQGDNDGTASNPPRAELGEWWTVEREPTQLRNRRRRWRSRSAGSTFARGIRRVPDRPGCAG